MQKRTQGIASLHFCLMVYGGWQSFVGVTLLQAAHSLNFFVYARVVAENFILSISGRQFLNVQFFTYTD